jgi:hypothetical protein
MSIQFVPSHITVNLPYAQRPHERNYDAEPGETIDQLLARIIAAHPDVTSVVLVALRETADAHRLRQEGEAKPPHADALEAYGRARAPTSLGEKP